MITIEQCKKILNKSKKKINDEEAKLVRCFLYQIAALQLENEQKNYKLKTDLK